MSQPLAFDNITEFDRVSIAARAAVALFISSTPGWALAQAQGSPFLTGATSLQSNILAWLTPIAIILVMVLGAMAMAARLSWGWCIGAIVGIAQVSGTYGRADPRRLFT